MAEPNPDDGLVPEISELYKRDPAAWTREAERRTKLDATVEKLEELESTKEDEKKEEEDEEKEEASNNNAASSITNNASEKIEEESKKKASTNSDAKPLGESSENKRKFKKLKKSR